MFCPDTINFYIFYMKFKFTHLTDKKNRLCVKCAHIHIMNVNILLSCMYLRLSTWKKSKPRCDLACQLDTCGKMELFPSDCWSDCVCGDIFLTANWCRRVQATVGSTNARQGALGCIRNITWEQTRNDISPWSLLQASALSSCFGFAQWCAEVSSLSDFW